MSNIQIIEDFLIANKQQLSQPSHMWKAIAWVNAPTNTHFKYVKLIKGIFGEEKLTDQICRELSILCVQSRYNYMVTLDAPPCIIDPIYIQLQNLQNGKGRQVYPAQLYKESLKHI